MDRQNITKEKATRFMKIGWSYLQRKFPPEVRTEIFHRLDSVIARGDFTLGREVKEFEDNFAAKIGIKHAIGVGNGTDALRLSLLAAGIKSGDEIITAANTFIATAGAICEVGAIPVFVDVTDNFCMDATKIKKAITRRTKAIMPVIWGGNMPDMNAIRELAIKYKLKIIEDSAQGIMSEIDGKKAGTFGDISAFSLHPLKNLSVWGDGGMIVTDNDDYAKWLRLYRNHGLIARNTNSIAGCNSRLDTVQAVVAQYVLEQIDMITDNRIKNAAFMDEQLSKIPQVKLSRRFGKDRKVTFTLYENFYERRDELQAYLKECGVEGLVHYPMPCYRNRAFQHKCKDGDFLITDWQAENKLSLPCHEHLEENELQYIIDCVKKFYA
jgi:dTDP-4-amino-4,6-dideoxygalactose transaminase